MYVSVVYRVAMSLAKFRAARLFQSVSMLAVCISFRVFAHKVSGKRTTSATILVGQPASGRYWGRSDRHLSISFSFVTAPIWSYCCCCCSRCGRDRRRATIGQR